MSQSPMASRNLRYMRKNDLLVQHMYFEVQCTGLMQGT